MKPIATIFAAMSIAGLASGTAMANCHDKTPSMNDQTASIDNQGIAKDGTHAPLEDSAGAEPANKEGGTMPLASGQGGGNKNLATSQQDVEAQQEGQETAAAQSSDDEASTSTDQTASIAPDGQGIAKDGTRAPLDDSAAAEPANKDGQTMPLASQEGGGNKNLATSPQDVEAQQEGEQTAAAQSDDCVVE
jgi:hypothetical protein